ncbi:MAG: hypothetical protein ACTSRZ_13005 [Promethearchaeota archaeon]
MRKNKIITLILYLLLLIPAYETNSIESSISINNVLFVEDICFTKSYLISSCSYNITDLNTFMEIHDQSMLYSKCDDFCNITFDKLSVLSIDYNSNLSHSIIIPFYMTYYLSDYVDLSSYIHYYSLVKDENGIVNLTLFFNFNYIDSNLKLFGLILKGEYGDNVKCIFNHVNCSGNSISINLMYKPPEFIEKQAYNIQLLLNDDYKNIVYILDYFSIDIEYFKHQNRNLLILTLTYIAALIALIYVVKSIFSKEYKKTLKKISYKLIFKKAEENKK